MRMLVGRPKDGERRLLRTHLSGGLSRGEAWNRGRLSWKEAGLELSFGDPASVRESRTEEEMGPHIHSESMTPTGTGQVGWKLLTGGKGVLGGQPQAVRQGQACQWVERQHWCGLGRESWGLVDVWLERRPVGGIQGPPCWQLEGGGAGPTREQGVGEAGWEFRCQCPGWYVGRCGWQRKSGLWSLQLFGEMGPLREREQRA